MKNTWSLTVLYADDSISDGKTGGGFSFSWEQTRE